jgi:hypothetical protein
VTLNPAALTAGSTGNVMTLVYSNGTVAYSNGTLVLVLPADLGTPQTGNSAAPDYVSVSSGNAVISSITQGSGGWTVDLTVANLASGNEISVKESGVTAPATPELDPLMVSGDPLGSRPVDIAAEPQLKIVLPTATPTPASGISGTGQVLKAVAAPNPQAGPTFTFKLEISGPLSSVQASIYSTAMVLVAHSVLAAPGGDLNAGGWAGVSWTLPDLSAGLYYVVFTAGPGQPGRIAKLLVLR